MRLRHAVRAILLTEDDHILLCRFPLTERPGTGVWVAPGGGIEPSETQLDALRRELLEEVGYRLDGTPPRIWHQEVVSDEYVQGYDGIINEYYLVRTPRFTPQGTFSEAELAAENISDFKWWKLDDITAYDGDDVFSPRALNSLLATLDVSGPSAEVVSIGL